MRSCYITQGSQPDDLWWSKGVGGGEGREAQEGVDICITMDDLHCCMAETVIML